MMVGVKAPTAAAICLALAGCGLPPIINGARFLILSDSGVDAAQLDFPDQRSCMAAQRRAGEGAARCQRITMWDTLRVNADVKVPDGIRIDGHFSSVSQCERFDALSRIGAAVVLPCVLAAPKR
jgi:hypothetical protein